MCLLQIQGITAMCYRYEVLPIEFSDNMNRGLGHVTTQIYTYMSKVLCPIKNSLYTKLTDTRYYLDNDDIRTEYVREIPIGHK